jgi:predicted S18 family serine protease
LVVDASKYLDALSDRLSTIQKEQQQNNTRTTSQKTIDANSDGNVLASFGIVKQQDSEE